MTSNPASRGAAARPALLWVIEDDPVSREWLRHCCEAWGYRLNIDGSLEQARARSTPASKVDPPAALLLDLRLPDGSGAALLEELRRAGVTAPAIAMSADLDNDTPEPPFQARLRKPLSARELLAALEAVGVAPPRWDDARGLRSAAGRESTLHALRRLLTTDLQAQRLRLRRLGDASSPDIDAIDAELHRLVGAARLTGAAALAAAVDAARARCAETPSQHLAASAEWQRLMQAIDGCILDGLPPD